MLPKKYKTPPQDPGLHLFTFTGTYYTEKKGMKILFACKYFIFCISSQELEAKYL